MLKRGRRGFRFPLVRCISHLCRPFQSLCDLQAVLDDLESDVLPGSSVQQHDWVRLFQACARLQAIALGRCFHKHFSHAGHAETDPFVGIPLLNMYCKFQDIGQATAVFEKLRERKVVAWTMIIGANAQSGHYSTALLLFKEMMLEGMRPSEVTMVNALTACCSPRELRDGALIHLCAVESDVHGLLAVGNTLVSMYGKCGSLSDAKAVFDSMTSRDLVSWSILILAYSRFLCCEADVLDVFHRMLLEGLSPNNLTLGIVLNACARIEALDKGKSIHESLKRSGMTTLNYAVGIALINLYGKCGRVADAWDAFQAIDEQTVVSWNSMMTVLIQHGSCKKAINLFHGMLQLGFRPTKVTFMTILSACSKPSHLSDARFLHFSIAQCGFDSDVSVANALVSMYDACGNLEDAAKVFSEMKVKDTISWNGMISAYIQHDQASRAKTLFRIMLVEGGIPDRATLSHALNACVSLKEVELVHGFIAERGDEFHGILGSALVTMHGKFGTIEEARRIFDNLTHRDIISWNGMVGACAHTGHPLDAWNLYQEMKESPGLSPSTITYVAVLDACTEMGALDKGREVHASIPVKQLQASVEVGISLVNLYGKCGKIVEAQQAFEAMEVQDVILWSSLVAAYAQLGYVEETLELVKAMQHEGFEPNRVTYVSVMSACSHAGLVEDAYSYFLAMIQDHNIAPSCEHYRCVVDLLARAGRLDDAEKLLTKVENIGPVAWMTMLAACKSQGDLTRARRAAKLAIKSNPGSSAGYVALFNTFLGDKNDTEKAS